MIRFLAVGAILACFLGQATQAEAGTYNFNFSDSAGDVGIITLNANTPEPNNAFLVSSGTLDVTNSGIIPVGIYNIVANTNPPNVVTGSYPPGFQYDDLLYPNDAAHGLSPRPI